MLERLFAPVWPPVVALVVALAVFVGVLLATPPGLAAVPELLLDALAGGHDVVAAYAAGAAAFWALSTLLILAPTLAIADLLVRRAGRKG